MSKPLTEQELREKIDRILARLENLVAIDVAQRIQAHSSGQSPRKSHAEARQELLALILQDRQSWGEYIADEIVKAWNNYLGDMPYKDREKLTHIEMTGILWGICARPKLNNQRNNKLKEVEDE